MIHIQNGNYNQPSPIECDVRVQLCYAHMETLHSAPTGERPFTYVGLLAIPAFAIRIAWQTLHGICLTLRASL